MVELSFPNPLTEANLKEINDALEAIRVAKSQIALAKKAGIDVAAQEAAALEAEQKLLRIKGVYFPNR